MRIVHEVTGFMQTGGGSRGPYTQPTDKEGEPSTGFPVELTAFVDPNYPVGLQDEHEGIIIEGDAAYILDMLKDMIDTIESIGEEYVIAGKLAPNWRAKAVRSDSEET